MGANILLVEDNPTNRDLVAYLLTAFGHEVRAVATGEAALAILREEKPDLILCDLNLPGIDGYEIVRRLRGDPALCGIPTVAVTAMAMVGEREKVLAAGFDGYISKPIDPETFTPQLDRFLNLESQSRPQLTGSDWTAASSTCPGPVTLLILDTLGRNGAAVRRLLAGMGFRLLSAADVPAAVFLARNELPDLIVSDVPMQPGFGCALLTAVRADVALARTPFAFIASSCLNEREGATAANLRVSLIGRDRTPDQLRQEILACLPAALRPLESTPLEVA